MFGCAELAAHLPAHGGADQEFLGHSAHLNPPHSLFLALSLSAPCVPACALLSFISWSLSWPLLLHRLAHGPAWATYPLIAKLLAEFGTERSQDYKEFVSTAVMPDVAILLVNYDPETEIGRHVVWHHVRGTEKQPSFNYVIDPASWIEAKQQVTMDLRHLRLEGGYYIEVKPLTYAGVKGK